MKSFCKCLAVCFAIGTLAAVRVSGSGKKEDPRTAAGAKALGMLYSAMLDRDNELRVLASEQWGPIGNPAAKNVLRNALKDKDPYVRIAAAGSLVQLGDKSGVAEIEKIAGTAPAAPKVSGDALGALDEMRALARNKVRVVAIRALGRIGEPSSQKTLRGALGDRDGSVRDAASVALARQGDVQEVSRLLAALEDEDPAIRISAVKGLGETGSPEAVKAVRPLAEDPNSQVRAAVMEALGECGSILALADIQAGSTDQNELVRSKAVAALGRLQNPAATQFLTAARSGASNAFIELLATAGLARLGETVDLSTARRALQRGDPDVRILAIEVMETVGGVEAEESLQAELEDPEGRVRVRAAAALVKLLKRDPRGAR